MSKFNSESIKWTVSPHAKQRAWERYGVKFSPRKWSDFCRAMQKANNLIRLESGSEGCRFACRFQGQWFFIGCSIHKGLGTVATFLPDEALTDTDKTLLASDDRYEPIGSVSWNAVRSKQTLLSNIQITQEELPPDFDQVSKLLENENW